MNEQELFYHQPDLYPHPKRYGIQLDKYNFKKAVDTWNEHFSHLNPRVISTEDRDQTIRYDEMCIFYCIGPFGKTSSCLVAQVAP